MVLPNTPMPLGFFQHSSADFGTNVSTYPGGVQMQRTRLLYQDDLTTARVHRLKNQHRLTNPIRTRHSDGLQTQHLFELAAIPIRVSAIASGRHRIVLHAVVLASWMRRTCVEAACCFRRRTGARNGSKCSYRSSSIIRVSQSERDRSSRFVRLTSRRPNPNSR